MLTLYVKTGCGFCMKTLAAVEALKAEVEVKNISEDENALAELMEKGGKRQVPFLVDTGHDISMYESDDIIAHLKEHHGGGEASEAVKNIKLHREDDSQVCESCQ